MNDRLGLFKGGVRSGECGVIKIIALTRFKFEVRSGECGVIEKLALTLDPSPIGWARVSFAANQIINQIQIFVFAGFPTVAGGVLKTIGYEATT